MTPTKEDHRVAIQCMNARYAEEAAKLVAWYRTQCARELVDKIILLIKSNHTNGVENPNAEQIRNPDKLA